MAEPLPITDFKDLSKIRTDVVQNRNLAKSNYRSINALDTETYEGDVFLIADSDGRYLDKINTKSVIEWLFSKKYQNSWNFFYNLDYDASVILKLLGNDLYSYLARRQLSFEYDGYRIGYVPSKWLRINKGHHSVTFFDIRQYYGGMSLVDAYQRHIGPVDADYLAFKSKRSQFSPTFYRRNTTRVRNYCIQDCKYTKELGEKWVNLFNSSFGFYPRRWTSAGYLAEKVLINNQVNIPSFDNISYAIQDLAYRSYFTGRFEMTKRGSIGEAYLYDINSAYPYALSKIPDLFNGKWVSQQTIHQDARLGFFRIEADILDNTYIAPFPFRVKSHILFPSGKFITYVTLDELLACDDSINYKILDSWQFIPKTDDRPFEYFIGDLYDKRLLLKKKDDPHQLPIKVILNSIYGKTGQTTRLYGVQKVMGNLFNPVIFAYITGFTRARLYRFVKERRIEDNTVSFATDSICVNKKLDIDNSEKLGDFSLKDHATDVYHLQNGIYRFNGEWKRRGLAKLNGKTIEDMHVVERNGRLCCEYTHTTNSTLRASILRRKISEVGRIQPHTKLVNLNADRKRFWLGDLRSLHNDQFNDSLPLSMSYFNKEAI